MSMSFRQQILSVPEEGRTLLTNISRLFSLTWGAANKRVQEVGSNCRTSVHYSIML